MLHIHVYGASGGFNEVSTPLSIDWHHTLKPDPEQIFQ